MKRPRSATKWRRAGHAGSCRRGTESRASTTIAIMTAAEWRRFAGHCGSCRHSSDCSSREDYNSRHAPRSDGGLRAAHCGSCRRYVDAIAGTTTPTVPRGRRCRRPASRALWELKALRCRQHQQDCNSQHAPLQNGFRLAVHCGSCRHGIAFIALRTTISIMPHAGNGA